MFNFLKRLFKRKPTKVNVKWDDWGFLENPWLYPPIPLCKKCGQVLYIFDKPEIWCPNCKTFLVWSE